MPLRESPPFVESVQDVGLVFVALKTESGRITSISTSDPSATRQTTRSRARISRSLSSAKPTSLCMGSSVGDVEGEREIYLLPSAYAIHLSKRRTYTILGKETGFSP